MATFTLEQTPTISYLFLYPNGASGMSQHTPVGESNNWECVDDDRATPDLTTYVYTFAVATVTDMYVCTDHTTESGTIKGVTLYSRAKSHLYNQSGAGIYQMGLTVGGSTVTSWSADIPLSITYNTNSYSWNSNPTDDTTWTWDMIDNLNIGVRSSSPSVSDLANLVLYPDGTTIVTDLDMPFHWHDGWQQCNPDVVANWRCVTPTSEGGWIGTSFCYLLLTGGGYECPGQSEGTDIHTCQNHTTETGAIESVGVYSSAKYTSGDWGKIKHICRLSGVTAIGTEKTLVADTYTSQGHLFTTNPSGGAWSWADVDNMDIGFWTQVSSLPHGGMQIDTLWASVKYEIFLSPEIRTTSLYAKVAYEPGASTIYLNKPDSYTLSHNRDTKKLNFWSGDRAVYDLKRSSKTLTMTGSEWNTSTSEATDRLAAVETMKDNGEEVTLSGFDDRNVNTTWVIRNFDYTRDAMNLNIFNWSMEMEKA